MSNGVAKARTDPQTASIAVGVYDGARKPLTATAILMQLRDGRQRTVIRKVYKTPGVRFLGLQPEDNFADNYAVIASPDGYSDGGFYPVKIAAGTEKKVSLLSIPKSNSINFAQAEWFDLPAQMKSVVSAGAGDDALASSRYSDLFEYKSGTASACLLNLLTSMAQSQLGGGTALDNLREIVWDRQGPFAIASDRFFAWADVSIATKLDAAVKAKAGFQTAPPDLHPGATRSYKQTLFDQANLQLTLHENDRKEIDGEPHVLVEPDIDYFKDPAAHLFGEVFVNAFGSMTDPRQVLALRWMAGRQSGFPDFDPLYTVDKA